VSDELLGNYPLDDHLEERMVGNRPIRAVSRQVWAFEMRIEKSVFQKREIPVLRKKLVKLKMIGAK
jgi:hypothetical protein